MYELIMLPGITGNSTKVQLSTITTINNNNNNNNNKKKTMAAFKILALILLLAFVTVDCRRKKVKIKRLKYI